MNVDGERTEKLISNIFMKIKRYISQVGAAASCLDIEKVFGLGKFKGQNQSGGNFAEVGRKEGEGNRLVTLGALSGRSHLNV